LHGPHIGGRPSQNRRGRPARDTTLWRKGI
jgi:hypothetical protein